MDKNEVYVTTDLQDERLWHKQLVLTKMHWINSGKDLSKKLSVRTRYRAPLVRVVSSEVKDGNVILNLSEEIRALTPGQSAVLYDDNRCVGGGIVI